MPGPVPAGTMPTSNQAPSEENIVTNANKIRRWPALWLAGVLAVLSACGGGGGDAPGTPNPPPVETPATLSLSAFGGSANSVSLAWTPLADASAYQLERRAGNAAWTAVAELPADAQSYVDDGLAAQTSYSYRLWAQRAGGRLSAESEATTIDAVPPSSEVGAAIGTATTARLGNAGGRIALPDGRAALAVPAGAFAAETELSLQRAANTAPDGLGDALRLRAAARPGRPLTLTLAYDAAHAADADGLGVALQRADGSWLALPIAGLDKARRELAVVLPSGGVTSAGGRSTGAAGVEITLDYTIVTFLDMRLSPPSATVRPGESQLLVPYARTRTEESGCRPTQFEGLCIALPMPVLKLRQVPFTNVKDGYTREWSVQGVVGGSAALGTVTPRAGTGALYRAPQEPPEPNPVTVTFRSRHERSGRTVEMSSRIKVAEPRWTSRVSGYLGAADIAFTFSSQAVWTRFPGTDRFEADGTQEVGVVDITCTGSASPAEVPLPAGSLVIDRSVEPPTYKLDMGSVWTTTISASCPGHGSTSVRMDVPGRLIAEGTVSGNGTKIEGQATLNGVQWNWSFSSEL